MVKAALTGNYGSGKSTVLAIFRRMGALCIDADRIVAGLLEDPSVLRRIRRAAGGGVFDDGGLSKRKLADLIFADRHAREAVEGIIHPLVMERIERELLKAEKGQKQKAAFIEMPLLYEKGYEGAFDKVVAVYAAPGTALARLQKSGISRKDASRRLAVQMPIARKIEKADYVIDNQDGQELTIRQAGRIYKELTGAWFYFQRHEMKWA